MKGRFRESYHFDGGLEQAVIDLVRVGCSGSAAAVRQLATRLIRAAPPGVSDPVAFGSALQQAIAVEPGGTRLRFSPAPLPVEAGTDQSLVRVDPFPSAEGLALDEAIASELAEIVDERRRAQELAEQGIEPTSTLLLSGSPGVGKTMAARWLAAELGLQIVSIDLAALISSFLGTTGKNLRAVFEYASTNPCVLLLDEFDAVAKRRDDETDVGELKRIVNVLLVELDRWPDTSLLVAATNHPQLLDPAIGRRFDRAVTLPLPGPAQRRAILAYLAANGGQEAERFLGVVAGATAGMSGSDLVRLWNTVRRRAVLRGERISRTLLQEIAQRAVAPGPDRDQLWLALAEDAGLSHRQIAACAGVSHPTVARVLNRVRKPQ
jgi:MoxR-like ATPase